MTDLASLLVLAAPVARRTGALSAGHRNERLAIRAGVLFSLVAWVFALVLGYQHWGDQPATDLGSYELQTGGLPISFVLRVDQLSASMLVLATSVAALVQIYSVAYLRGDPRYPVVQRVGLDLHRGDGAGRGGRRPVRPARRLGGHGRMLVLPDQPPLGAARGASRRGQGVPRSPGSVMSDCCSGSSSSGEAAGTYRISGVVAAAPGRIDLDLARRPPRPC